MASRIRGRSEAGDEGEGGVVVGEVEVKKEEGVQSWAGKELYERSSGGEGRAREANWGKLEVPVAVRMRQGGG